MSEPDDIATVVDETEVVERSASTSWGRRLAKGAFGLVIGMALAVVAAILLLDTGPGRRFVAEQVQGLEFENGMKIGIGRIEGSLYGAMTIHDLSIKDPKGEFAFSPEVVVDWHPFAFVNSHVDIDALTAEKLFLRRVPEFNETPPSDAPLLPDLDIDIDRLEVSQFIVEKPVTGEPRLATLSGTAHIADGRAKVRLDGKTLAVQGNAGGDTVRLLLDAVPEANRLAIDLNVDAPGNGVVAALAGLSEPLDLKLAGKGDWKRWDGKLAANFGGGEIANLALTAREGTFAIKGPARLSRFVAGPTANLLGASTSIDLTAALKDRRADVTGSVSSDAFRLNTNGLIDLSDNSFENMNLAFVLFRPSTLAENLRGSGLRAVLLLDGAFATPRVQYSINANRIAMNDMGLEQFTASGDARVDADRIMIPVSARARRITGLDTVAGGTLANVRLTGDVAIDGTRILSDNMRVMSDRIDAKAILLADTSTGLYTGAIDGRIDNYRVESVGIFNIETDVDLKSERDGFALAGKVRARSTTLLNDSVKDFLGGNAVASADVKYGSDGLVQFANLRLEAPGVRVVGGKGSYSPDGRIAINADAVSRQYGKIGVRVAGSISNPQARIMAERPDFGIGLANVDARITGARGGYRLDLKSDTDYGPLTADVTLGLGNATSVRINKANLSGVDFTGSLTQTRAGPFAGELRASGNGMGGIVRLGAAGRYQEAVVNLRASNSTFQGPANLAIGSAIVDARVVLYDQPHVVADVQLADTRYGAFDINAGRVLIDYRNGSGQAKAVLEGSNGAPFRVAANAQMEPKLWRVMMTGKSRGVAFKTASPARIIPGAKGYELLPTKIDLDGGSIKVAGNFGDAIKVQSRLEKVDLALLNSFSPGLGIGGTATGSLDFEQPSANAFPRADARLSLDRFTRTTSAMVSQPVNVNFVGKLLPDGGEARAVIRRRGAVIGRMNASLRPLPPGAGPWMERLMSAPLGGGIRYNGPAETLFSFAGQAVQSLSGPIGVAADFSCRVENPCLNGIVKANSLTYENQQYGTRLSDMALSGRFTGNRLEVERLKATAGNGTLEAKGYISLAAGQGYPMDLDIDLQNARLARSDALSARATGDLRLTKAAGQTALLSGELRLPETRYTIIREGAAQVPQLTGVRFKPPKGRQRITGEEPAEAFSSVFSLVRLDISMRAPEKLYVSGMGLESEWKANFTVAGTSNAPTMTGTVDLIRGTLGFAGRSFELTEGRIGFTGGPTIDPTLRIVANEDVEDVSVNVNITGRATNPQIAFNSIPGLPQDEIMSRILFGSSIANLSAIQAVQLASSLNSLRGSGGGLNPLGKLRSATGIDRLRILGADEASGRGTALAAGQYITDDIYVELITDTRGFTATQLEVAITPWLSVLSQAGGSGANNVNVRIKKNY
ncbi:MAG: translocation/assembly module TamB domain-containing protein [Novosphingobium sp.]|nr:translocation/assembly module TamB domain-containing protein [Novosphingobium sp.]